MKRRLASVYPEKAIYRRNRNIPKGEQTSIVRFNLSGVRNRRSFREQVFNESA